MTAFNEECPYCNGTGRVRIKTDRTMCFCDADETGDTERDEREELFEHVLGQEMDRPEVRRWFLARRLADTGMEA